MMMKFIPDKASISNFEDVLNQEISSSFIYNVKVSDIIGDLEVSEHVNTDFYSSEFLKIARELLI